MILSVFFLDTYPHNNHSTKGCYKTYKLDDHLKRGKKDVDKASSKCLVTPKETASYVTRRFISTIVTVDRKQEGTEKSTQQIL
jgi:hypothetical protein